MRKHTWWALSLIVVIGIGAIAVMAYGDDRHRGGRVTVINAYGATPFLYGGYSYIPLKSASDFLGAALLWDSLHHRATVTYHGRQLGLTVGSNTAYYGGQPVALPVPPVMVGNQLLVPAMVFDRYLEVPVEWDDEDNRVLLQGPPGWGYYQVLPYAPAYVVPVIRGHGPPPWAPAHGLRRKRGAGYYPAVYAPAPFVYLGTTYVPLRDAATLVGAALLWDSLHNRAVITYNGREFGLVIGSPSVLIGGQAVVLRAAPILVNEIVFVPVELLDRHMGIPVGHGRGAVRIKGPGGWRDFRVAPKPPGRIHLGARRRAVQRRPEPRPGGADYRPKPGGRGRERHGVSRSDQHLGGWVMEKPERGRGREKPKGGGGWGGEKGRGGDQGHGRGGGQSGGKQKGKHGGGKGH